MAKVYDTRAVNDYNITLYGFTGNKWLHVVYEESRGVNSLPYFAKVSDDFSLDKISDCCIALEDGYRQWNPLNIGFNIEIKESCTIEVRDRTPDLPFKFKDMYPLFDLIIKTGKELGQDTSIDPADVIDDVTTIMEWINEDVIVHNRKLDLLKGKELLALINDLDTSNQSLIAEQNKTKTQNKQIVELQAALATATTKNQQLEKELEIANTRIKQLMNDRTAYTDNVLTTLRTALSNLNNSKQ